MTTSETSAPRLPRIAVILAAGRGTRLRTDRPKVLHEAGGKPLAAWGIDAALEAGCERVLVVIGHGADEIRRAFAGYEAERKVSWVLQTEQKGTGDALARAEAQVEGDALLLVLPGDAPLVTSATLTRLADAAEAGWGAVAVAELDDPASLGRVLLDERGGLDRIVEAKDAGPEELAVKRVNAGFYAVRAPAIFDHVRALGTDNAQGELYLTDAVVAAGRAHGGAAGGGVAVVTLAEAEEAMGVNTRADLARVERSLRAREAARRMEEGVTLLDPDSTVIDPEARVGRDAILHRGVCLLGHTEVGDGAEIHAGAWLRDTRVAAGAVVEANRVLDGAEVE